MFPWKNPLRELRRAFNMKMLYTPFPHAFLAALNVDICAPPRNTFVATWLCTSGRPRVKHQRRSRNAPLPVRNVAKDSRPKEHWRSTWSFIRMRNRSLVACATKVSRTISGWRSTRTRTQAPSTLAPSVASTWTRNGRCPCTWRCTRTPSRLSASSVEMDTNGQRRWRRTWSRTRDWSRTSVRSVSEPLPMEATADRINGSSMLRCWRWSKRDRNWADVEKTKTRGWCPVWTSWRRICKSKREDEERERRLKVEINVRLFFVSGWRMSVWWLCCRLMGNRIKMIYFRMKVCKDE